MNKVFFTADSHFGHRRIIRYCNRPFGSIQEMNATMVERWNSVVRPEDIVYHLGDFAFTNAGHSKSIFDSLNGTKILIRGNHDGSVQKMLELGFKEVHESLTYQGWYLIHRPTSVPKGCRALVGHVHEKFGRIGNIINVGVDRWNFYPVTLDQLRNCPEDPAEFACRNCNKILKRLDDNKIHFNGDCV